MSLEGFLCGFPELALDFFFLIFLRLPLAPHSTSESDVSESESLERGLMGDAGVVRCLFFDTEGNSLKKTLIQDHYMNRKILQKVFQLIK